MIKNKKGGNMKEMTMPQNYVELEQEEMMYLEGGGVGYHWYNKVSNIANAIDIALGLTGIWFSAARGTQMIAKFGSKITSTLAAKIGIAYSTASRLLASINSVLSIIGNATIGNFVARGIDRIDGRYDGYCFA
jgi:hypothetical protein